MIYLTKKELKQTLQGHGIEFQAKNLDQGDPVKDSMKKKLIPNMNEAAQTDLDKGVADCVPEAPVCKCFS